MPKMKVLVDMGTGNISVFCKNLLLREPNIALVRRKNGLELVAFGSEALGMSGSAEEHCSFINPVSDGAIVNAEVASLIISRCLSEVLPKTLFKSVQIYAVVPCGLTLAERENTESAFLKAGYRDVTLVESVLGLLPFVDGRGSAVALIGGGTSEFAVLNDAGILTACSLNIGGKEVDKRIKEKVLDIYNLSISDYTAEKLKIEIGSLYDNNAASAEITGRGVLDRVLRRDEVTAENIKAPIALCYKKIAEVAESLLTTVPSQMLSEVTARGLYLAGGGAAIEGLENYLTKYLRIPATVDPEPETAVLRGLNTLIENGKLDKILGLKR